MTTRFAVLVYPGTEPIDLATFGVLSMARRVDPGIEMHLVAQSAGEVELANGMRVIADFGFQDWPGADVLIVTGGPGWMTASAHEPTLQFLRTASPTATIAAVCTGGMILAAAGLLDGKKATTKRRVIDPEKSPLETLKAKYPEIEVVESHFVDSGDMVTGGGVSLCIDTTLNLLKRFRGAKVAAETARIIEYDTALAANEAAFAKAR